MINHREKLDIITFYFKDCNYPIKKTTESGIIVKSSDDKKQIAKIDYESLRVVLLTKDSNEIQDIIECLERCENRFRKELKNINEFTVV
jgi:hypothetical protein